MAGTSILRPSRRGRQQLGMALTGALLTGAGLVAAGSVGSAAGITPQAGPAAVLAGMTQAQRVGQLFMVGSSAGGPSSATVDAVRTYHVGNVILTGRSSAGVTAVRGVSAGLQSLATTSATAGVPLFVATDQEGGKVQVLSGPGFSTMPSGLSQGSESVAALRVDAQRWGGQLQSAGVNLDLAPVVDTVPPGTAAANPPIGYYDREYGFDTTTVAGHGAAFVRGMHAAHVATSIKHFPGLGRVPGNPDTTSGVTDTVTTRTDPYLGPFAAGVSAGAPLVMVSTAYYSRIDASRRAAFSPTVIGGMLRGDLRFRGVVISDDLGNAAQVQDLSPAARAVDFLAAGGDMVLTVNPSLVPAMVQGVLSRAASDAGFSAQVQASVLRVLIAKQQQDLIGGAAAPTSGGAGQLTVVQRADDASVVARYGSGSTWSGPSPLGGVIGAGPLAAGAPGSAVSTMAVRGTNSRTYVKQYAPGGSFAGYQDLGGATLDAPAVAVRPGLTDVAVRGTDGALYLRSSTSPGAWGPWVRVPSNFGDSPALGYTLSGDLIVAVTGTNQQTYVATRHGGTWSPFQSLGGVVLGPPGLSVDPSTGAVTVYQRGTNAGLYEKTAVGGTWGAWHLDGGTLASSPTATAEGSGEVAVLVLGTDGLLYRYSRAGSFTRLPF